MLVQFIVLAPTNSGLRFIRELGLKKLADLGIKNIISMEERGEKIPELIDTATGNSNPIIGIDGSDLVADFNFAVNASGCYYLTKLYLDFKGQYAESVFGLPTLTLLGRNGLSPEKMKEDFKRNPDKDYSEALQVLKRKRVIVPRRYINLLKKYIPSQAQILTNGRGVDVEFARDKSIDYAIDVVVKGQKCKEYGIGMIAPIFRSDGILIGNQVGKKMFLDKNAPLGFASYNDFFMWFNTGRQPRQYYGERYPGIH